MKKYVFAGLVVFAAVLVVTFPARVAYQWFAPPDLQLNGISGSVWHGSADEGMAGGAYIRQIRWRLKAAELVKGRLAFEASASPAAGSMTTDVAVGLGGSLELSNLSGSVPLDLVHPALQQSGMSGDLSLRFEKLVIEDGLPVVANGSVTLANLYIPNLSAGVLGEFRAEFLTAETGVTGSVDDVAGVLDVAGVVTIAPDRTYALVGEVAARPGAPPSIEQQLRFLGSPNEHGLRPFRFEGRL
ncbi:MAG: type II secretion system protein N [Gammaproteobacteria bacterium]|nr:type II secretion system protein N [Gammaproteobacteria bacterium]